ncbi:MAG: peptide deformylase [Ruminococcaceae bacterium]|nr:peptide deformylase [Oscillospiraceae bacterium]
MAKRKIVQYGDDTLRRVCRPVDTINKNVLTLLDDMAETMRANDGVGLAAPQVGILRRIAVIEVEPGELIELINPKIVAMAGEQEGSEGCLSLPGQFGMVKRPKYVTVRATDRHGKEFEMNGTDLLARAFCHEIEHLDGKLFIDSAEYMLEDDD